MGAEVNAKDASGNTALDWALKRGETPSVQVLRAAGAVAAKPQPEVAAAITSEAAPDLPLAVRESLPLLQKSSTQFLKKSGCISCHHQSIGALAVSAARAHASQWTMKRRATT